MMHDPSAAEMRTQLVEAVQRNHAWLCGLQVTDADDTTDFGGLRDPLEGTVQGEHYSASHFAWAGVNIAQLTGTSASIPPSLLAAGFTARHLRGYPKARWAMHSDFNNFALSRVVDALGGMAEPSLSAALKSTVHNRHLTANWCAMRAAVHFWLARRYHRQDHRLAAEIWLNAVLLRQQSSGLFNDHWDSASAQYHAFTASVLSIICQETPSRRLERALKRAAVILLDLIDADGEVLCVGRGHRQIFGYACAIHFLTFCSRQLGTLVGPAEAVWRMVRGYQRADGSFPLVLGPYPDSAHVGWYDYNRLSVYNAFACAWLSETAKTLAAATYQDPR
jgi:hypothetical protein